MIPSPQDPMFGPIPLPDKFKEFRPEQWDTIQSIISKFDAGVDVVFLSAPTGAGKTLIGEAVRRLLDARAYYTCVTKSLQDQFVEDFHYAAVLKGRANYLTASGPIDPWGNSLPVSKSDESVITCADCTGMMPKEDEDDVRCEWCPELNACPFYVAKAKAQMSPLAVVNNALLLSDLSLKPRELVIADEADKIERLLMDHVSLDITPKRMAVYGLRPPDKKTVEASWIQWAKYARQIVEEYYDDLPPATDISAVKERRRTRELLGKLDILIEELPEGGWVYDGYREAPDHVKFKPIRVNKYAGKHLWGRGKKWLLMSASFVSVLQTAEYLGLFEEGSALAWDEVKIPSSFPKKNRPVFVVPVADMTYKNKEASWPKMVEGVDSVLRKHEDDRILVHTNGYELSHYLHSRLSAVHPGRRLVTYTSSNKREAALESYRRDRGAVLFAPSMDRGIDLPDDLCRVQVIAKVPFPNTKDKQIAARAYSDGGSAWYTMETIRTIEQMTGRGMRHKDDYVRTYILDAAFIDRLWQKADYMFDDWWAEAVRWDLSPMELEYG